MCEMQSARMPSLLREPGILSCDFAAHRDHCSIHHRFSHCDNQMSRSLMKGSFTFIRPIFPLPGCLFRLEASLDVTSRFPLHRYQWRRERLGTTLDTRLGAYCSTQHKRLRVAPIKSSAYRTKLTFAAIPFTVVFGKRSLNLLSSPSSVIFASTGEMMPPCGVPSSVG